MDYSITKEKYNALKQSGPAGVEGGAREHSSSQPAAADGGDSETGESDAEGDEMEVDSDASGNGSAEDGGDTSEDERDDGEDDDEEGGPDAGAGMGRAAEPVKRKSDVQHGCTVFVRNVAFDCGQEEVKERFGEFGNVRLALLVKDRATQMPRGTAFVKARATFFGFGCYYAVYVL